MRFPTGTLGEERALGASAERPRAPPLASVARLASGIAHDVTNVLPPTLLGVPLLRAHITAPGDLRLRAIFEKSAGRGAALVRQIRRFAPGRRRRTPPGPGHTAPPRPQHGHRRNLSPQHPRRHLHRPQPLVHHRQPHPNPPRPPQPLVTARDALRRDAPLTLRAENLVRDDLAMRAMPGAGPGPALVRQVEDTDTGILPDVLAQIGDACDPTKQNGKGTGQATDLGLSTVRGMVAPPRLRHCPEPSRRGTTFRIFHPAAEGALGETPVPASVAVLHGNGELSLLVAEVNIRNVTTTPASHSGYRVSAARDGRRLKPTVKILAARGPRSGRRPGAPAPPSPTRSSRNPSTSGPSCAPSTTADKPHRPPPPNPAAPPPPEPPTPPEIPAALFVQK